MEGWRATGPEHQEDPAVFNLPTINAQGDRPRDTQRQRVYDAEGVLRTIRTDKAARRLLVDEARLLVQTGWHAGPIARDGKTYAPSIDDCQRYVDEVLRGAYVQRRWGQRTLTVGWKASGSDTCTGTHLALPPWSRHESVILHEIAHALTPDKYAAHGPEFAGVLLSLVRHRMGAEAGTRLCEAFRAQRARVSVAAVPAPTQPVVTAADRAAKAERLEERLTRPSYRRAAADTVKALAGRQVQPVFGDVGSKSRRYAQDTARALAEGPVRGLGRPARHEDIEQAAAVVRACVKADLLGKVGSKPRARALAVARRLDEVAPSYRPDEGRRYVAKPAAW